MPEDTSNKKTVEELFEILKNRNVVKEGEYDCTINNEREHSTIRFEPTSDKRNLNDDPEAANRSVSE